MTGEYRKELAPTKPLKLKPAYTIERGRVVAISGGLVYYADTSTYTDAQGISSDRFTTDEYVSIWNENNIVFIEAGDTIAVNDNLTFGASSYEGKLLPVDSTVEGDYLTFARAVAAGSAGDNILSYIKEDTIRIQSSTVMFTPEKGLAMQLINDTGAASIKGTVVEASSSTDLAFKVAALGAIDPIGVVYEDGVADGDPCWMVFTGIAEVLVEDGDTATLDYWAGCSPTTAGRVYIRVSPPSASEHDRECGHVLEAKASGTDVLTKIILHFR